MTHSWLSTPYYIYVPIIMGHSIVGRDLCFFLLRIQDASLPDRIHHVTPNNPQNQPVIPTCRSSLALEPGFGFSSGASNAIGMVPTNPMTMANGKLTIPPIALKPSTFARSCFVVCWDCSDSARSFCALARIVSRPPRFLISHCAISIASGRYSDWFSIILMRRSFD